MRKLLTLLMLWIGLVSTHAWAEETALPPPPPFNGKPENFESRPSLYQFDANGVIQIYRSGVGWYYSPTGVAQYVNAMYAAWYAGDRTRLGRLQANAAWLRDNTVHRLDVLGRPYEVYEFPFAHTAFGLPAGWISGLTAAEAVAALYSATLVLGDPTFAQKVGQLLPAFELTVQGGGYRIPLADRMTVWYEEVADSSASVTPRILNGHMYALVYLDWYARYANSTWAARLAQAGFRGLQYALPHYDVEPLSLYDLELKSEYCSYHKAHVLLLQYFYALKGTDLFDIYATLWGARSC